MVSDTSRAEICFPTMNLDRKNIWQWMRKHKLAIWPFLIVVVMLVAIFDDTPTQNAPVNSPTGQVATTEKKVELIEFFEREGTIDLNGCREVFTYKERPPSVYRYTCMTRKNDDGSIANAICCRAKYASFSNQCLSAHCYSKE